jgi:hypothetical protein
VFSELIPVPCFLRVQVHGNQSKSGTAAMNHKKLLSLMMMIVTMWRSRLKHHHVSWELLNEEPTKTMTTSLKGSVSGNKG